MSVENYRENLVSSIENYLKSIYAEKSSAISSVHSANLENTPFYPALNYTLLAGGKRIRPMLCLIFAKLCADKMNVAYNEADVLPSASAIEMIHTYSLIHDDLPAMDDDDLRRGKPTCHKAYDEATAILTGDALLTDAFNIFTQANFPAQNIIKALQFLSICTGSKGMIAGQILDLAMEKKSSQSIDKNDIVSLQEMNARKTGDLLLASCAIPALLYGTDADFFDDCKTFAINFGIAFQITDDILDVVGDAKIMGKPQGSDLLAEKTTWVSLLGLENARQEAINYIEKAEKILSKWQEENAADKLAIETLSKLLQSLTKRTK